MILKRPSFERSYNNLTPQQQSAVDDALTKLEKSFGHPHEHAGIGVRTIGRFFECRAGLQKRILFVVRDGDIVLVIAGNHDEIRAYIKNNS